MNVLLDECVPGPLGNMLKGHNVSTTQEMGWASKKNGDLISLAEKQFDLFITSDQNLSYQQNLSDRKIAILVLPTNRWKVLSEQGEVIADAVQSIGAAEFKALHF